MSAADEIRSILHSSVSLQRKVEWFDKYAEGTSELIKAAEEVIKNRPSLATKVCKLVPPLEQALAKLNTGKGETP